jgi:subtilisin family serine protease
LRRRALLLFAAVALAVPAAAAAFANTEPLAPQQWYLEADNAWTFWPSQPQLFPVPVAVIDSGIDGANPDLVGRVLAARSFVGGSPYTDEQGHGTFVAGEIAANPGNALGVAGLAFNARLLVAKVVTGDGSVSLQGEVEAIRWAVDRGARVINLSLGGVRDPLDASVDTYSPLEQAAIDYAWAKGVVVVAAVGNGPQAPRTPWRFADYPAALPHVIGVGAVRQDGSVPDYSNRDAVYNDLAAPGDNIVSTIPVSQIDATRPACAGQPFSTCGPAEFRDAIGTSFAAPQVSAAAALLIGEDPRLRPEQVAYLLERSADDASPATGCSGCLPGRDPLTGFGTLDVQAALTLLTSGSLPPVDRYEPNDDAGPWAHALPPLPRTVSATLDYWDDQVDVYRVHLSKGQRLYARLTPPPGIHVVLTLWPPGTKRVESLGAPTGYLARWSRSGRQARIAATAPASGVYYLEAKLLTKSVAPVAYRLALSRRSL